MKGTDNPADLMTQVLGLGDIISRLGNMGLQLVQGKSVQCVECEKLDQDSGTHYDFGDIHGTPDIWPGLENSGTHMRAMMMYSAGMVGLNLSRVKLKHDFTGLKEL